MINESIRHSCKKSGCFIERAPDIQKMTAGCFMGNIRPGDMDAEIEVIVRVTDHRTMQVERKSYFLVIESKKIHEKLDNAQKWTLEARAKQGSAVVVIYHDEPDGSDINAIQTWNISGYNHGGKYHSNLEEFRRVCSWWFGLVQKGEFDGKAYSRSLGSDKRPLTEERATH